MVDALASGASVLMDVEVRVLFWAPQIIDNLLKFLGLINHSTRKWFITQCERTGVPEHFTASLVGHHSARSANKLTYGLYSAGISDAQKREIVDGVRLPD